MERGKREGKKGKGREQIKERERRETQPRPLFFFLDDSLLLPRTRTLLPQTFGLDFHIREIPHQGSTDPLILLSGVREAVARLRREIGGENGGLDGGGGPPPPPSSSSSPPPPRLYTHEEAFALLKDAERAMTSFYESAATDAAVAAEGLELLPGVEALLENLARREGVVQGLVTGNLQPIGWRKVETLGVARHFDELLAAVQGGGGEGSSDREEGKAARKSRVGGFGSDHCSEAESAIDEPWRDRARFIEIAAERALRTAAAASAANASTKNAPATISRRIHIGDTVYDLKAAAAAGALPVGVATGIFSKEELAAARVPGAVILDDLSDLEASLRAMGFSV